MTYEQFLDQKRVKIAPSGFEIAECDLNPALFPFQKYIVKKALHKGKYAVFADCGLGKTIMQLEWAHQVSIYTNRSVLILAPLAVSGQTIQEGEKFGIDVKKYTVGFAREAAIYITNYEQLDHIIQHDFSGVVLDESSILKNFTGAIKQKLISMFKDTEFKLCCTATPSPNDPEELGNHSEFLNVMNRNEMLAMYFIHDGGDTGTWKLKPHGHKYFWAWVSEWAVMLCDPADIGFPMEGYDLPELKLIESKIITKKRDGGSLFFNEMAVSATDFNQELRFTKIERLSEAADIANGRDENFIIWVKHNEEGEDLKKMIRGAVEVKGSDTTEYKEEMLLGFANNKFRALVTKTKIAMYGMNYQNCHNQIFPSLDFSFEGLYQAIRRSYRFGQKHPVNIWIITTDTMTNVIQTIHKKQKQFLEMQNEMNVSMNPETHRKEKEARVSETVETEMFTLKLGDCVQLIKEVPDESIGFSIFSPPFAELYTYSDELEDMGNSKDYSEFLFAFNFLVKDLYRVLWSGRNVAVHCMDLPIQKGKEGYIGLRDFSNMIRQSFEDASFIYHSRTTIWRNPVTEMQRTKALGLLHKQVKKDSAMSRTGLPDYLLVFRKPGEHLHPVHCDITVDTWQKYASPVWMDINYSDTLNARSGRDEDDTKHICPLQRPTIKRAIHLWTNKGDKVLSPFAGIGSEVHEAIELGRYGIGFELKPSYFKEAVKNCTNAMTIAKTEKIF
jgi:hypothetical protein